MRPLEMAVQLIGFGSFRRCHRPFYQFFIKRWHYTTWNHRLTIKRPPTKCTCGRKTEINLNHENHVASSISNKLPGNLRLHLRISNHLHRIESKKLKPHLNAFKCSAMEIFITTHVWCCMAILPSSRILRTDSNNFWQSMYFR